MNEHPIKHPPLFTKDEVVKDVLENMSTDDKARLKHKPKEDLVMFHHGWAPISATTIRCGITRRW